MSRQGKSGAAQRAYDKRTARAAGRTGTVAAAGPSISPRAMLKGRVPFVASVIGLLSIGLAVTLLLTTRAAEDSYQLSDARAYNQSLVEQKAALERDFQSRNSAPELAKSGKRSRHGPRQGPCTTGSSSGRFGRGRRNADSRDCRSYASARCAHIGARTDCDTPAHHNAGCSRSHAERSE